MGNIELSAGAFSPVPRPEQLINYGTAYGPDSFGPSGSSRPSIPLPQIIEGMGGISEAEHREIDAAADEQRLRAERVEQLSEFVGTIHPDRLLDIAGNIAQGVFVGPPPPPAYVPEAPPPQESAPNVFTTPVGAPEWIGSVDEAPWTPEPDLLQTQSEEEPMADLTDILSVITGVGQAYQSFQGPQQVAQPAYQGSWQDWLDGPTDWLQPSGAPSTPVTSLPTGGTPMANGYGGGCISQRDRAIAAASGATPELVDRVLHYARQGRRRRRRMVTKGDIGDIATMKQILGNGESFKVWLAKATR